MLTSGPLCCKFLRFFSSNYGRLIRNLSASVEDSII